MPSWNSKIQLLYARWSYCFVDNYSKTSGAMDFQLVVLQHLILILGL
jgi:hypothetical protein